MEKIDIKETAGITSSKYTGQKIRVGKNKDIWMGGRDLKDYKNSYCIHLD